MRDRIALRKMPGVQKDFALHKPKPGPRTSVRKFGDDEEDADPADKAVAVVREPETAADHANMISDAFGRALVWASDAHSMVEMGWRLAAMLKVMRPELLENIPGVPRVLEAGLMNALAGVDPLQVGSGYKRLLAWCRRCKSLSQMGQRTFAMIYILRRDLLSGRNTNAAIASLQNKTRQAFNRTVGNFRDTFAGFRNAVMRGEETRTKCRKAQQI